MRRIVAWLALSTLGGLPAAAQTVTCSGSQLSYLRTGNTAPNFNACPGWGRCQDPIPGSVSYSFDVPGCNPLSATCGMKATVPVEFPGNHQNDPGASGGAYSFAEVQLLSSTGSLVGHCGTAGAVIEQDLGTITVTAGVTCANSSSLKYTLQIRMCPPWEHFVPAGCIKTKTVALDF